MSTTYQYIIKIPKINSDELIWKLLDENILLENHIMEDRFFRYYIHNTGSTIDTKKCEYFFVTCL